MAKKLLCIIALMFTIVCALVSCSYNPTFEISDDGYWIIDGVKTEHKARGDCFPLEKYQVAFNTNCDSTIETQEVAFGNKAKEPTLTATKAGYDFDGWYVGDEKWSFIGYSVTENITLTAKWTPTTYTITYRNLPSQEYSNFNEKDTQTYTIEDAVELYTPPSNGKYSFCGWYTDEALTQPLTEISEGSCGDITLYAKWETDPTQDDEGIQFPIIPTLPDE